MSDASRHASWEAATASNARYGQLMPMAEKEAVVAGLVLLLDSVQVAVAPAATGAAVIV